ncbi:MAG: hypothetical protein WA790_07300 [Sulfitobacter sp.]
MKSILKSTTSIGLSFALAMPTIGFTQTEAPACSVADLASTFPCSLEGQMIQSPDELLSALQGMSQ